MTTTEIEVVFDSQATHQEHHMMAQEFKMVFVNAALYAYFFHHNNPYLIPIANIVKITWIYSNHVGIYRRTNND